ncbi:MAG TPA: hypothetical protein VF188_11610 [Longimicrobiales bacterium]
MHSRVVALKQVLEERFPDAVPPAYRTVPAVATGIAALDGVLPGRGLPRGRLSTWRPGGAATALLRMACRAAVVRGERSAWVDGAGAVTGESWRVGPLLFRPGGALEALVCAEELVRSGGFGLVVVTGVDGVFAAEAVRLSRAVGEGGGVLVVVAGSAPVAALRLSSRIEPAGYRWRRGPFGEPALVESVTVRVRAAAMGWSKEAELTLRVAEHGVRLSLEPGLGDRRGARR